MAQKLTQWKKVVKGKVAKRKDLTVKQRRFVAEYASNGGNAAQAALRVYDTRDYATAAVIGSENLRKPNIREEIEQVMEKVGLQTEDAVRAIRDALDAESERGPDWSNRLKAADMTLKLADAYPKETEGPSQAHLHQHLHLKSAGQRSVMPDAPLEVKRLALSLGRVPSQEEIAQLAGGEHGRAMKGHSEAPREGHKKL